MPQTVLVRYGAISEVARFDVAAAKPLPRGADVVVRTHRGLEVGTLLEDAPVADGTETVDAEANGQPTLLREATGDDVAQRAALQSDCRQLYGGWCNRIREWNLELELIDLEWMLDKSKLVLYVLNDRGSDCTRLALQAAAAGEGIVEVQPVSSDGLVAASGSGGCGSGGCGSCGT